MKSRKEMIKFLMLWLAQRKYSANADCCDSWVLHIIMASKEVFSVLTAWCKIHLTQVITVYSFPSSAPDSPSLFLSLNGTDCRDLRLVPAIHAADHGHRASCGQLTTEQFQPGAPCRCHHAHSTGELYHPAHCLHGLREFGTTRGQPLGVHPVSAVNHWPAASWCLK